MLLVRIYPLTIHGEDLSTLHSPVIPLATACNNQEDAGDDLSTHRWPSIPLDAAGKNQEDAG
jgi:hypothetical protein